MRTFVGMPEFCFTTNETDEEVVVAIYYGDNGYRECYNNMLKGQVTADEMNKSLGVTKQQEIAMKSGSMFGWHILGADPAQYDENGKLLDRVRTHSSRRKEV